jgi:excisionase family DNA binding protein
MPTSSAEDFLEDLIERIAAKVAERFPAPPSPAALPPQQADYLTTKQAAKLLALSVGTLEGWRSRGDGPAFVKIGTAIRYSRADLDAWLAKHARRKK